MTPLPANKKLLRRSVAVAAALCLHAALFYALVFTSSAHLGDARTTGDGVTLVEGVNMDLVGTDGAPAAAAPPSQPRQDQTSQRMDAFAAMTVPMPSVTQTAFTPANPARSINEALNENPFDPGSQAARNSDEGHVRTSRQDSKTANDLWKAIEPCWNRVADKSTLSVTLQVSFSPLGNLSKPPVIERDVNVRTDERVLRSESQAITALAQCGPYLMAFGQQNVEVRFPRRG